MEIKKGFTLIELLVSMFLLSIFFIISIKVIKYIYDSTTINEYRYLALNRIDSEMSRLVYFYKNYEINYTDTFNGTCRYYEANESEVNGSLNGLLIENDRNIVEIKNINIIDRVVENDIVGLFEWSSETNGSDFNLSVNITYPYRYKDSNIYPIFDFVENINLKTSVRK